MSHIPPCTTELEIRRLLLLNQFATQASKHHPAADDGKCFYCGFRPVAKSVSLCEVCEGRRQMLAKRYPEVATTVIATTTKVRHPKGFEPVGPTATAWSPHNSE